MNGGLREGEHFFLGRFEARRGRVVATRFFFFLRAPFAPPPLAARSGRSRPSPRCCVNSVPNARKHTETPAHRWRRSAAFTAEMSCQRLKNEFRVRLQSNLYNNFAEMLA